MTRIPEVPANRASPLSRLADPRLLHGVLGIGRPPVSR